MSNTIKYGTEIENNTLKKGNFVIGINDVDYGPTSETGYHNTITPPEGGYVVYKNRGDNQRSIYVAESDEELVLLKDDFGATGTTANDILVWAAQQNDIIILNNPLNNIVTDELVLYLDADFTCSYPKANTTWYDLSGNEHNGTLGSSVSFEPDGGWMVFDGGQNTNYNVAVPINRVYLGDTMSVSATFKYNGAAGDGYRPIIGGNDPGAGTEVFFGKNSGNTNFGVQDGNYRGSFVSNYNVFDGNWHHMTYTYDNGAGKIYLDGELRSSNTFTKANDAEQFYIGAEVQEGYWWDGLISEVKYYKKTLSSTDVAQNYYKGNIVTRDLQQHYDFGNIICKADSGSTIRNLANTTQTAPMTNTGDDISYSKSGGYLEWAGNNAAYVDIPDTGQMGNFSLSAWIYNKSGGDSRHSLLRNFWEIVGTSLQFWSYDFDNDYWRSTASNIVPYDTWTHITTTWNGSVIRHYANGSLVWTDSNVSSGTSQNLYWMGGYSGRKFKGRVATLSIYTDDLSAEEVLQNYNAQKSRFGL
jgi:hypothetical protein